LLRDGAGNVYAAGFFRDGSSYHYVAKWNGTSWAELGTGSAALNANGPINSIATDGAGNVYAVGYFTDGNVKSYVAKWNGTGWQELGTGTTTLNANSDIRSVVIDGVGNLYAAGEFTDGNNKPYIAEWTNTLPPTVSSPVTYCQNAVATALTAQPYSYTEITGYNDIYENNILIEQIPIYTTYTATLNWYGTNAIGGTASATAPTPSTSATGSTTYYVSNTINGYESERAAIVVTVNPNPVTPTITTAGNATTFCSSGVLTANSVTGGVTYQWSNSSGAISGATNSTYTATAGSNYTVTTTLSGCSVTSAAIAIIVNPYPATPTITTAGNATTFCGSGVLTANSVTGGVTYQWRNSSGTISGATNSTYTATASGNYTVTTTLSGCSITSAATAIIINPYPATPTIAPGGTTSACTGGSISLTASDATSGVSYQWNTGGSQISGATATSYTATAAGTYTVTVTSAHNCSVTSAMTTVPASTFPTATISNGSTASFCSGGSATLNANTGTGLTYQWSAGTGGAAITGATNASYTAASACSYTVTVTNANNCSVTSVATTVTLNALPTVTITNPAAVCSPSTVNLTATSVTSGSTSGLTYTYWTNSTATTSLSGPSAVASSGTYYIEGTNSSTGCSSIKPVTVTVNPSPNVTVSAPSGSFSACSGDNVLLSVPTGPGLTYQWYLGGSSLGPGATTCSYAASAPVAYTVNVTNSTTGCTATSSGATITLTGPSTIISTPTITPGSGSSTFCAGGSLSLTAGDVTSGVSYQWYNSGVTISGATNAAYSATASGNYTVAALKGSCSTYSTSGVTVTVNPIPATPTITGSTSFCAGGSTVLTANSSTSGVTYQWLKGGSSISGATNSAYTATSAATYSVEAISAAGCSLATSAGTAVTVTTLPTVTITNPAPVCLPSTVDITAAAVTAGSTSGLTYTYWTNSAATTPLSCPSALASSGTYYIEGTNSVTGCSSIQPVTVTANATISAPTSITPSGAVIGGATTYTENGGTGATYIWTITGGTGTGSTSGNNTITWNSSTGASIQVQAVANGCSSSVYTQPFTVSASETWTGANSTDWNTAGNWSLSAVPNSQVSVTIAVAGNLPVIGSTETAAVNAVTISTGASLTLNSGSALTIYGNFANSGTVTDNGGTTSFVGASAQSFTGPAAGTTLSSVTLNNSAGLTLNNPLTITGILTLSKGIFTTNNNFSINLNQGEIAYNTNDAGNINGMLTTLKNEPNAGNHYISSPVTGATVAGVANYTPVINTSDQETRLYSYSNGAWQAITSMSATFTIMQGYSLYFTTPITFGFYGNYDHTASYSVSFANSSSSYQLVGNPYPSNIDWTLSGWTKTHLNAAIYYWDSGKNRYASYVSGPTGTNGGTKDIPAMQGFWVQTDGLGGTATLTATNGVRETSVNALWRLEDVQNPSTLSLQVSNRTYSDELLVRFAQGATINFDGQFDAYKFMNSDSTPSFYSVLSDTNYSINSLSDTSNITIPLSFEPAFNGTYTISSTLSDSSYNYILTDSLLHVSQSLLTNPSYTFNATTSDAPSRFYLNAARTSLVTSLISPGSGNLYVTIANDTRNAYIAFINCRALYADIYLIDVFGRTIWQQTSANIASGRYIINGQAYTPGVYVVKVVTGGQVTSQKVVFSE